MSTLHYGKLAEWLSDISDEIVGIAPCVPSGGQFIIVTKHGRIYKFTNTTIPNLERVL